MDQKVKELAAFYNTFGYESDFSRMAEKAIVNNDPRKIQEAMSLAAIAREML